MSPRDPNSACNQSLTQNAAIPHELSILTEEIGKFIEYWGFKAIHGRIWALLYLSKEPMSSIEISRKLKVSKTLLSFSIAELIKYGVIQEAGKGIKRTVFFGANPNLTEVILNVLKNREMPLMAQVSASFRKVQETTEQQDGGFKLDHARTQKLGEFIFSAQEALQSLVLHTDPNLELRAQFLIVAAVLSSQS